MVDGGIVDGGMVDIGMVDVGVVDVGVVDGGYWGGEVGAAVPRGYKRWHGDGGLLGGVTSPRWFSKARVSVPMSLPWGGIWCQ